MNLIGYWIRSLKDEDFCAPQEVVGFLPQDVRAKVASYLDAGSVDRLNSQCGHSWCRFFCGVSRAEMGTKELTDGCWIWPEGLSHYVRAHGIILPEEFVAHALTNASERARGDSLQGAWERPSLDYWRQWCAARRSRNFLERLRRARTEADVRAQVVEQRKVSNEIARHGLGEDSCIFAGCGEKVLSGMKLCARHVLRDTDHIADGCYAITPELIKMLNSES